ncbi:hypothetical protein EVAR_93727_1 [Eumeta japonica]|uniref:Uncharacterized protein n=1 Tax=Eumeta variegata TaxID=151549 RepID=A0A4C1U2L2_EUMVA|nr:hypothetical protein EVAR_93727_1 [Eumeta japonica]
MSMGGSDHLFSCIISKISVLKTILGSVRDFARVSGINYFTIYIDRLLIIILIAIYFDPIIDYDLGFNFDSTVDYDLGSNFDPTVDYDLGSNFDLTVDYDLGSNFDLTVDYDLGSNFDPMVDYDLGSNFDPTVDYDLGSNFDLTVDYDLGSNFDPMFDYDLGSNFDLTVDYDLGSNYDLTVDYDLGSNFDLTVDYDLATAAVHPPAIRLQEQSVACSRVAQPRAVIELARKLGNMSSRSRDTGRHYASGSAKRKAKDEKEKRMKLFYQKHRCKYYSVSLDSTPDISHVDQLTLIVRYVLPSGPVERFVKFLDMEGHTAEQLAQSLLDFLSESGIDIKDCRGQSYDNASNMSGNTPAYKPELRK